MKMLSQLLRKRLRLKVNGSGHCAIYENQLQRIWPIYERNRKAKIQQFAKERGFRLAYYKQGVCAIFEEEFATPLGRR